MFGSNVALCQHWPLVHFTPNALQNQHHSCASHMYNLIFSNSRVVRASWYGSDSSHAQKRSRLPMANTRTLSLGWNANEATLKPSGERQTSLPPPCTPQNTHFKMTTACQQNKHKYYIWLSPLLSNVRPASQNHSQIDWAGFNIPLNTL